MATQEAVVESILRCPCIAIPKGHETNKVFQMRADPGLIRPWLQACRFGRMRKATPFFFRFQRGGCSPIDDVDGVTNTHTHTDALFDSTAQPASLFIWTPDYVVARDKKPDLRYDP